MERKFAYNPLFTYTTLTTKQLWGRSPRLSKLATEMHRSQFQSSLKIVTKLHFVVALLLRTLRDKYVDELRKRAT